MVDILGIFRICCLVCAFLALFILVSDTSIPSSVFVWVGLLVCFGKICFLCLETSFFGAMQNKAATAQQNQDAKPTVAKVSKRGRKKSQNTFVSQRWAWGWGFEEC